MRVRYAVRVQGIVQGVGFRPFVYSLARRLELGGQVANDSRGVIIEVEGTPHAVADFLRALREEAPPLARVDEVEEQPLEVRGDDTFVIGASETGARRATLISPDVATCGDCLRDLDDPSDRRHRYAFTNCTNCGPRFTIVCDVPYDRPSTTMAPFPMCPDCAREYHDPLDRRFHAQPVACPACGPRLALEMGGQRSEDDAIGACARLLREGRIVAVKGLGGYHLAAHALDETACQRLRSRKAREEKPFAVMVADLEGARALARVEAAEEALLTSLARPIVLCERQDNGALAPSVAPRNHLVGLMLPYTPLHHLLMREVAAPVVLTSGNLSDEPIAYRDEDARARLGALAEAFLTHDRAIHIRTDDSVVRAFRGGPMPLRRSRGYVPAPIALSGDGPAVLACGGELKSTICVTRGRHAFISHHIGDLENLAAYDSFCEAVTHFERLFDVRPAIVAHDLHPEYLSTKWAVDRPCERRVGVQHHHAHIASCLVDNGEAGPVIGIAFDGLGYGVDGTLWGGEVLLADLGGFERLGHLRPVAMPGGEMAIRQPWRMAAVWLIEAYGGEVPAVDVKVRNEARWDLVLQVARTQLSPRTSSVGRLFDAIAAVVGVRDAVAYEGQAAIELEQMADAAECGTYPSGLRDGEPFEVDPCGIVRAVVEDMASGTAASIIAARAHNAMADLVLLAARAARERCGLATVALSGGVFQNMRLLEGAVARLERDGFRVLWHRQVPCNDGGLSLGQAAIARHAAQSDGE